MKEKRMRSGRFIGVMSGTSLDGIDVVLALLYAISTEPVWTLVWGGCLPMPYWR